MEILWQKFINFGAGLRRSFPEWKAYRKVRDLNTPPEPQHIPVHFSIVAPASGVGGKYRIGLLPGNCSCFSLWQQVSIGKNYPFTELL